MAWACAGAWTVAPVYARFSVKLGKMLDARQITGEYRAFYLRNIDVKWDRINIVDLPTMDFDDVDRQEFSLRRGDLLVCEGGEVGRCAIWNEDLAECFYQKALHRLRPKRGDLPRYMLYVIRCAAMAGAFVSGSNQSTIDHLTAEKLRRHRFAFAPAEQQQAIVQHIDAASASIEAVSFKLQTTIERLLEYRAALITAAVTGQLDLRKHEKQMEALA